MTRSRQTADWGSRAGLAKIIPSSVAVGSGTGSADSFGTVTFSGASSISLNGIFSSTYDDYLLQLWILPSTSNSLTLRYRTSGTDNSNGSYFTQSLQGSSSTISGALVDSSATNYTLTASNGGSSPMSIQVKNPFLNTRNTESFMTLTRGGEPLLSYRANLFNASTSFDGLSIIASTGTLSGTIRVYGYTN